jgi:hypothetical protein
MNGYTAAAIVVGAAAVVIAIGCAIAEVIEYCRAEKRQFDKDIEAVARAVGVLPGPEVQLDPNFRSSAYDPPRRFVGGIE